MITIEACPYCGKKASSYRFHSMVLWDRDHIDIGYSESKTVHGVKYRTFFHVECAYKRRPNELTNI